MKKKMNKSILINNISRQKAYLKKSDVEESVNQILDVISDTLFRKDRIEIRGFGTFSSRCRNARLARNPKTGTSIIVNSKFRPYFRPAKLLRQELNS